MSYYENLRSQIDNAKKLVGISLETKDGSPQGTEQIAESINQMTSLVAEQGKVIVKNAKAYEELKKVNDRRLDDLEKRGSADVLDKEQLERINADLNQIAEIKTAFSGFKDDLEELAVKMNRPDPGSGEPENKFAIQHKAAFNSYVRDDNETGIKALEQKDAPMIISSPTDGGYAVPEELDRQIMRLMKDDNVMRRLCNIVQVGSSDWKKLVNKGGADSGWVGETDPRVETDPSKLAEIAPTIGEMYAYPGASQYALDDIYYDVEGEIRDEVYDQFADEEELACFGGDGVKKPMGALSAPFAATADKSRAFGTVEKMLVGATDLDSAANQKKLADAIMKLPYRMKNKHRKRAVWLLNSITMGEVRLIKDEHGRYIWREGLESGTPNTLNGLSTASAESMPDVAANAKIMALGNWKRAYTIIDRKGIRFLRDPFNKLGYVYFYFTKRMGGHFIDTEAYKVITLEA